jgi:hypothetical protein
MSATVGKQVKTWRVLHDNMKVGDSTRNFGDLMPEAAEFDGSVLRTLMSTGRLEEMWVDQSVVEDFIKGQKKKDAAAEKETDTESEVEDEVPAPKKRVAKKSVTKKKTIKKGKTSGLAEQSV